MSEQSYYDLEGWAQVPCNVSEMLVHQETVPLGPYSTITDPDGHYGRPLVYTEWGVKDAEQPVLRNYRWPDSDRDCEHWINTKSNFETRVANES